MYTIIITKKVENPNYKEERKEFGYAMSREIPGRHLDEKHLEVTITDEEFQAVKKAVIGTM